MVQLAARGLLIWVFLWQRRCSIHNPFPLSPLVSVGMRVSINVADYMTWHTNSKNPICMPTSWLFLPLCWAFLSQTLLTAWSQSSGESRCSQGASSGWVDSLNNRGGMWQTFMKGVTHRHSQWQCQAKCCRIQGSSWLCHQLIQIKCNGSLLCVSWRFKWKNVERCEPTGVFLQLVSLAILSIYGSI